MAVKLHVSNISRNHWCNIIKSLVESGKLTLENGKCYDWIYDFLFQHADYEIGTNFRDSLNQMPLEPKDVLDLVCCSLEIWHNGNREMHITFDNSEGYFLYDGHHKENLFITDDYEQWVQKVWDLVYTVIRFFGNKDSWLLEEGLYFMLQDLDLADDLIFDLNDLD